MSVDVASYGRMRAEDSLQQAIASLKWLVTERGLCPGDNERFKEAMKLAKQSLREVKKSKFKDCDGVKWLKNK